MHDVLHGAGWAFGLRCLGAGTAFLFNVVIARMLGANEAGLFFLALAIVTVVASAARLGLDKVLLRVTAQYAANQQWTPIRRLGIQTVCGIFLVSSVLALSLYLQAPWIAREVFAKPALAELMQGFAFGVVFLSLYPLAGEMLRGLYRIKAAQFILEMGMPLLSLVFLLLLSWIWSFNVVTVVWAFLLAAACLTGFGWYLLLTAVALPSPALAPEERWSRLLRDGLPLLGVLLADLAILWMPILALGYWGTASDVGVLHVAVRTAMLTSLILTAVNAALAPKMAVLYQKHDKAALEDITRKCTLMMCLAASPILIGCFLYPEFVLSLFGSSFVRGAQALMIIALGEMVNVWTGSVGSLLMMTGHERILWFNNLGVLLLNGLLVIWLVPVYGLFGAAATVALTVALKNIMAAILVKKYVGVLTFPTLSFQRQFSENIVK